MLDFNKIKQNMEEYDNQHELLVRKSRDVLKLSKQIINSVQRENINQACELKTEIEKEIGNMKKFAARFGGLKYSGSYKIAMQEYTEAVLFLEWVKNSSIPTAEELGVEIDDHYLLGVCDLTGELVRRAVRSVTKEDYQVALSTKELLEDIYSELLKMDFKNNELRRKFDSIKYDLKKLEDIVYELKLRDKI